MQAVVEHHGGPTQQRWPAGIDVAGKVGVAREPLDVLAREVGPADRAIAEVIAERSFGVADLSRPVEFHHTSHRRIVGVESGQEIDVADVGLRKDIEDLPRRVRFSGRLLSRLVKSRHRRILRQFCFLLFQRLSEGAVRLFLIGQGASLQVESGHERGRYRHAQEHYRMLILHGHCPPPFQTEADNDFNPIAIPTLP